MITNIIAIFIGGGLGAVLRYMTGIFCSRHVFFALPVATLLVNIIGSFIIGLALAFFLQKNGLSSTWKLAITVGFCGGLTTFSTFSVEVFELLKTGHYLSGLAYIAISVLSCIFFVFVGLKLGKLF